MSKDLFIDFCDLYDCAIWPYEGTTLLKIFKKGQPEEGHIFEYLQHVGKHGITVHSLRKHSFYHSWAFYRTDVLCMRLHPNFPYFSGGFDRVLISSKELSKFVIKANENAEYWTSLVKDEIIQSSQNNYLDKEIEETEMEITRSNSQIKKMLREKTKNKIEVDNVVFEVDEEVIKYITATSFSRTVEEVIAVPKENINICFVGGVSTGKSTILNAIFCEQLTQCKIKRTTMVPTVYIENQNQSEDQQMSEKIFNEIAKKNKEIIDLTERGIKLTRDNYSELVFNVGKLDINILPDSFVNVYDIPGLNDARTKDVYYDYLETNFYKFNLVIFIVDIHSGLNTSDEIDIVNFITRETRHQLEVNGRKIFTLVVVNKADDMVQDEETKELHLTGELKEMYDQVDHTITSEFQRKDIAEHLIGILPLCALDSYLYRMVRKHGSQFKLSEEQILKIGVNEMGKQFSKKKKEEQEKKVKEILQDSKFIDDMIDLSGFGYLERKLHEFLHTSGQGKEIRISNLLYEVKDLPSLTEAAGYNNWFDLKNFTSNLRCLIDVYSKIKTIDEVKYTELFSLMSFDVNQILMNKVQKFVGSKEELLSSFDSFFRKALLPYLEWTSDSGYPSYLTSKIIGFVRDEFQNTQQVESFCSSLTFLKQIDAFKKDHLEYLVNSLASNGREEFAITFTSNCSLTGLLILLKEMHNLEVRNMLFFTRLLIANQLASCVLPTRHLLYKSIYYESKGEIPVHKMICNEFLAGRKIQISDYCDGLEAEERPCLLLDNFYLDTFCRS